MNILEKIDNYFYEKPSQKEFYYTLVLIVGLIGFGFYYYIFPIAQNYHSKNEQKYDKLNLNIQNTKRDITLLKVKRIKLLKEERNGKTAN